MIRSRTSREQQAPVPHSDDVTIVLRRGGSATAARSMRLQSRHGRRPPTTL